MKALIDLRVGRIKAALNDVGRNLSQHGSRGNTVWTNQIKAALTTLARSEQCKVCGRPKVAIGADYGEWLYDVVWYRLRRDGLMTQLPLVAECEWLRRGQYWEWLADFQKLIQSRAELRLFIWQTKSANDAKMDITRCRKQIEAFQSSKGGDRYLFAVRIDPVWIFEEYCKRKGRKRLGG